MDLGFAAPQSCFRQSEKPSFFQGFSARERGMHGCRYHPGSALIYPITACNMSQLLAQETYENSEVKLFCPCSDCHSNRHRRCHTGCRAEPVV